MRFYISRETGARALVARWALRRVLEAHAGRVRVHLEDPAPGVRSVVLASLGPDALGREDEKVRRGVAGRTLSFTADADPRVRSAAFAAVSRLRLPAPAADVARGLADEADAVRSAATRALAWVDGDPLDLLPALDQGDASLGRTARGLLRVRAARAPADAAPPTGGGRRDQLYRLGAVPSSAAEPIAVTALADAEVPVRREAALALAALARSRHPRHLQPASVDALIERLSTERVATVRLAVIEALESSGDPRAAEQLSTLATRGADLTLRLRLLEAATLARYARPANTARSQSGTRRGAVE